MPEAAVHKDRPLLRFVGYVRAPRKATVMATKAKTGTM
jgi:hypothetical protein